MTDTTTDIDKLKDYLNEYLRYTPRSKEGREALADLQLLLLEAQIKNLRYLRKFAQTHDSINTTTQAWKMLEDLTTQRAKLMDKEKKEL